MLSIPFNPFTWHYSRKRVHSDVLSLDIKDNKGNIIDMSQLISDISIELPLHPGDHVRDLKHFAKPTSLQYHVTHVDYDDTVMKIEIKPQTPKARYVIYIRYEQRPTTEVYDLNQTVSSKCILRDTKEYDCVTEIVQLIARKSGPYFIGILGQKIHGQKSSTRKKRSCFGRVRQKRSCIEVKDPPPTPASFKNVTVTPEYDSLTDVNYTLSIRLSSCVYWSHAQEKWITDGCKVRRYSNLLIINSPTHPSTHSSIHPSI